MYVSVGVYSLDSYQYSQINVSRLLMRRISCGCVFYGFLMQWASAAADVACDHVVCISESSSLYRGGEKGGEWMEK